MNTYATKPSDITRKWYVVDATDVVLGRLAAQVAKLLRGKHKPYFTPNLDCGDYVGRFPERVVEKAVERMISRNPMGRQQMTKLKVYAGENHPHTAQNPEVFDIASMNEKNKRSEL